MKVFFRNHDITIYRNRKKAGADRFTMSATFTVYQADIQPASDQRTEFLHGRIGATFIAYVDSSVDIKEGDEVHTEDSKVYSVKGVANWSGAGLLDHKELSLTSKDG
jgi:hypothetical protein